MRKKERFSLELKKECLDLILLEHYSICRVSKEKSVSRRVLNYWLTLYQQKGLEGLLPKKTKTFTASFKFKVITAIAEQGISVDQACIDFDIGSRATILNWQKRYNSSGLLGLQDKSKGRPKQMKRKVTKQESDKLLTKEELLLENESLKAELDYLKKLHALVQAKTFKKKKH